MENLCRLLTKKDIIKLMTDYNKYLHTEVNDAKLTEENTIVFKDLDSFAVDWVAKHIKFMSTFKYTLINFMKFMLPTLLLWWGMECILPNDIADTVMYLVFYTLLMLQECTFTSFIKLYDCTK